MATVVMVPNRGSATKSGRGLRSFGEGDSMARWLYSGAQKT